MINLSQHKQQGFVSHTTVFSVMNIDFYFVGQVFELSAVTGEKLDPCSLLVGEIYF